MTTSTYNLPSADIQNLDPLSLDSIWPWMSQLFDFRFWAPTTTSDGNEVYPRATVAHKTATYDLIFKWTTTTHPHEALYEKLETYLGDVSRDVYEKQIVPAAKTQALIDAYLSSWKRYDYCTNVMDKELNYYNRHFVKRLEDEGQGPKGVDPVKWGFPEKFAAKEDAQNAAKAAADEGFCPIRALGLRKWRQGVAEKVKEDIVGILEKEEDGDGKKKLAEQIRMSFLATGIDPTSEVMVKLRELSGEEAAMAKGKGKATSSATAEASISLWLVPPAKASQALEAVIASIASTYKSPKFRPHVTLLSFPATPQIDPNTLLPPRSELPPAVPITFQQICTGNTYFQSVLIELEKREDSVLQALYDQVDGFNQKDQVDLIRPTTEGTLSVKKPFYPHLSLYYGDSPMEVKEEIIESLTTDGAVSISGPLT
ncbi:hypothetical protein FRC05_005318, partial [Tulasnella sp. 425]